LCELLLSPANCLLLDEPTNHLDIRSKDILMDSFREYGGPLVFVSHDRYFLDGLATKVLEVGNGTAAPYLGNYEDYLFKKKTELETEAARHCESLPEPGPRSRENGPFRKRSRKKVNPYKIQQLAEKIEAVEATIHTHETRIAALAQMLASEELYRDYTLFRTIMEEHTQVQEELASFMEQWEKLQTELAQMTNEE
jgi:ATP-binding cassette subfamily F protein 3